MCDGVGLIRYEREGAETQWTLVSESIADLDERGGAGWKELVILTLEAGRVKASSGRPWSILSEPGAAREAGTSAEMRVLRSQFKSQCLKP